MSEHILVIGSGSVGKRHARNFAALGCRISCVDLREDRIKELADETEVAGMFTSIPKALAVLSDLTGVVVASPTAYHRSHLEAAVRAGLPTLLEKPMARSAADAEHMRQLASQAKVPVLLGYTWRWWRPLGRMRELLQQEAIGKIRHAHFHMSAHLADWHPWEPYQSFFMASTTQGGGALLDESHWIDLMVWLFGMPDKVSARVEKISDLEIETDDNVDIFAIYSGGLRVSLHLDLYGRPHEKSIRFVGEEGTLVWSTDPNRISIGKEMGQTWLQENFQCERNDMFVAVAREFLAVLNGTNPVTCTLGDGLKVMQLIETIRASSLNERTICIGDQRCPTLA